MKTIGRMTISYPNASKFDKFGPICDILYTWVCVCDSVFFSLLFLLQMFGLWIKIVKQLMRWTSLGGLLQNGTICSPVFLQINSATVCCESKLTLEIRRLGDHIIPSKWLKWCAYYFMEPRIRWQGYYSMYTTFLFFLFLKNIPKEST